MRNGNLRLVVLYLVVFALRSYRTYEEWKRSEEGIIQDRDGTFLPYLWGMETRTHPDPRDTERQFLPYLWGMETHF